MQQRVEIIKLLYREANILIFDEPTAVLTPQEADELFEIMRTLVKQGKSIIFITHKLREVLEISDRVMVIRRGAVVGSTTPENADKQKLAEMMVGRSVHLEVEKAIATPGDVVLEVKNLVVVDPKNQIAVDEVTFDVRAGRNHGRGGRAGQRTDRTGRGCHRAARAGQRKNPPPGPGDHQFVAPPGDRTGLCPCSRRPPARWAGPLLPSSR